MKEKLKGVGYLLGAALAFGAAIYYVLFVPGGFGG